MTMSAKMKLLKGPTLQRILLLVLLSLSGLGHPPNFCEGLNCYDCNADVGKPACSGATSPIDSTCSSSCQENKRATDDVITKSCGETVEGFFKCCQEKMGQSGPCCRTEQGNVEHGNILVECLKQHPIGRAAQDKPKEAVFCLCRTDLCNTDELFNREPVATVAPPPGPPGPGVSPAPVEPGKTDNGQQTTATEAGTQAVLAGRKVIQGGIAGLIIIRLATNGLFF